jgi:dTDP-4-dehydrorhamnose reductase
MNIFLLGSKGYLGSYLQKHLQADTTIKEGKTYDYFINCAARASLEECEESPQESYVSNYKVLTEVHDKIPEAKIITFSSYYVYDSEGYCNEMSPTTSRYEYTKHKLLAEDYAILKKGIIFRLGKLFGNYLAPQEKLTEAFVHGRVKQVDRVLFNPTSVKQVLRAVEYELMSGELEGVFNLSNKGYTTHLNYCNYIDEFLDKQSEFSIIARMPKAFHNYGRFLMDCKKIEQHLSLIPWQSDLEDYLKCIA